MPGLTIQTTLPDVPGGVLADTARRLIDELATTSAMMWHQWKPPPLYKSGVRYQLEPTHMKGLDDFALAPQVLRQGWADCDDAAIYRIAELRVAGEPARCRADWVLGAVHVRVRRGNGSLEDPSVVLIRLNNGAR